MSPLTYSELPATARDRIATALTPRTNEFIPRTLTTQNSNLKQRAFLVLDDEREVFYGGAAGGAKTSGILAAALQYVDVPGYHALLLRRNYKQLSLPGSWIPMSHEWLDSTSAHYHEGKKQWVFPNGSTLTFGFVGQNREDVRKYETANFSFIGIDELTAWAEADYTFLFSRLRRRTGLRVPSRMRAASNPGGRGHEWVKRRFVDPATRRGVFLPALLTDNPYIDREDYIASLQELHPTTWRRLLHGDWDIADPGEMFQPRVWLTPAHFLDTPPERVLSRVRYWDLAASEPTSTNPDPDWTAGCRVSRVHDPALWERIAGAGKARPLWVIEHMVRLRATSGQVESAVRQTMVNDGRRVLAVVEQDPGQAGKSQVARYVHEVRPEGYRLRGAPVSGQGSKAARARPVAADMEPGHIFVVKGPWNDPLFDEMEAFSEDPAHSGAHDDQVDALSGAYTWARRGAGGASLGAGQRGAITR